MPVKNKIAQFAQQRGLSIAQIVEATGVSRDALYKLSQNPNRSGNVATFAKICDAYNTPLHTILEWEKGGDDK